MWKDKTKICLSEEDEDKESCETINKLPFHVNDLRWIEDGWIDGQSLLHVRVCCHKNPFSL